MFQSFPGTFPGWEGMIAPRVRQVSGSSLASEGLICYNSNLTTSLGINRVRVLVTNERTRRPNMPGRSRDTDTGSGSAAKRSTRRTIPASKVGVTLRISTKVLKKLDRIQEDTIKAAQEDQKYSWR